ncbi:MAG: hypothetical protein ACK4MS_06690 [Paracoccaceae bacterium]
MFVILSPDEVDMYIDLLADPAEILRSPHLDVVPYAPRVLALSEHLGIDLSATLYALGAIPLCQPRDSHPAVRRAAARMISERSGALRAAIPDIIKARCTVLTEPGRVDVMREVVEPLVSDTLSILADMPIDVAEHAHIGRIFSQTLGVAKRRKMEHELDQLVTGLRQTFPDADDETVGLKLSLAILGRDAMIGTLGCTLHDLVLKLDGAAWSTLAWPETPTRTGVPYIDRVAVQNVTIKGRPVDRGGIVRAQLDDYETAQDPRSRLGFFGAGAHLCLGRALTLDLWSALGSLLAQCAGQPHLVAFALRRDDVFHIPETLVLEIKTQ